MMRRTSKSPKSNSASMLNRAYIKVLRTILKLDIRLLFSEDSRDQHFFIRQFLKFHRRLPNRTVPSLNDQLYFMKSSGELHDSLRQFVTDKEFAKIFIASEVGHKYVIKTLTILRNNRDIEEYRHPGVPCVMKPTHWSGRVLLIGKHGCDIDRELLTKWMDGTSYYDLCREQNYRYLVPKIIVEEFFGNGIECPAADYKVFCFRGVAKFIQVDTNRFSDHRQSFYDLNWNRLPIQWANRLHECDEPRPETLSEIIGVSEKVARRFSFIRVDCYARERDVRVGELTNCPHGANRPVYPLIEDIKLGRFFGD